jgi:hypothetical protein
VLYENCLFDGAHDQNVLNLTCKIYLSLELFCFVLFVVTWADGIEAASFVWFLLVVHRVYVGRFQLFAQSRCPSCVCVRMYVYLCMYSCMYTTSASVIGTV